MRKTALQAIVLTLVLLATVLPAANAQEKGWNIRLNGTWTIPETDSVYDGLPDVQIETNTGETFGLALSGEYRFSDRLGLEVGAQAGYEVGIKYDVREKLSGGILGDPLDPHPGDDMRFTIVDAALNIYLSSGGADFYVGPVIGFVTYAETVVRAGSEDPTFIIENSGNIAFGAVVGLDIPLIDSPWFFTSSIKYLKTSYDSKVGTPLTTAGKITHEVDFDPFIFRLGLGYKF